MSKLFDKLFSKLLALFIVVLFVIAFRELILTDSNTAVVFGEIMGLLPFAKVITDVVCDILKCQYAVPIISSASVMTDLLKLSFMACLQPVVVGLLTAIFLPLPGHWSYHEKEDYMDGLEYRIKELILTVASAPVLALTASWLSTMLFNYLANTFGTVVSAVLGILATLGLGVIAIVPLLMGGVSVGTAVVWYLLITIGAKMVTTLGTTALCLTVYVAFLGGVQGQIVSSIVALIVWLVVVEFGVKCLQHAVVG